MNMPKHRLAVLMLSIAFAGSLGGCAAALIGGAAAAGGASIADRRSTGAQTDDEVMEQRVKYQALQAVRSANTNPQYKPKIAVVSYNRRILLLGHVASDNDRQTAEAIARSEKNALAVYNHIQVVPINRTFGHISNDTWITTKLRTHLINVPGVYFGHVKVVTYDGTAYVMGILAPNQQAAVTERVRTTPGVRQVVTLYETYQPETTTNAATGSAQ